MSGWLGVGVGVLAILVSLLIYRASRIGPRLVYQERAMQLIGREETSIPEALEITSAGKKLRRLTKYYMVIWNSGNQTVYGYDVILTDPVMIRFKASTEDPGEILTARIVRSSRGATDCSITISKRNANEMAFSFDFLDPGDGALIEALHTSAERYPKVTGTIRGMPAGLRDRGLIPPFDSERREIRKLMISIFVISGTAGALALLFAIPPLERLFDFLQDSERGGFASVLSAAVGALLLLGSGFGLWAVRRRTPKGLDVESSFG